MALYNEDVYYSSDISNSKEEIVNSYKEQIDRIHDKEYLKDELSRERNRSIRLENEIHLNDLYIKDLEKNEIVKEYLDLKKKAELLRDKKVITESKVGLLEERVCDHSILYIMLASKKEKYYKIDYKCLSCGKDISGLVGRNTVCINQNYMNYDDNMYYGTIEEYEKLRKLYLSMKAKDKPVNVINLSLLKYLHNNHNELTNSILILRKKEQ